MMYRFVLLLLLLLAACQGRRADSLTDLLIGQWRTETGGIQRCFDGEVATLSNQDGSIHHQNKYRVKEERLEQRMVVLESLNVGTAFKEYFQFSEDGKRFTMFFSDPARHAEFNAALEKAGNKALENPSIEFQYVDGNIKACAA